MPEFTALTAARSPFGIPSPFGGRRRLSAAARLLATWADSNGGLAFDFTDITASQAYGSGKIIDGATPANNWSTTSSLTPFDKLTFTRASTAYYYNSSGVLTQAGSGVARIDYNPSTLAVRGLLVEEARTNLCLRSQEFSNAQWVLTGSTVTADAVAAPDGTTTADFLKEGALTSIHNAFSGNLGSGTSSGTTYAASVYAKRNGRDIQITMNSTGFGTSQYANFNLATGALGTVTGGTATIEAVSSGFYRCTFAAAATATDASGAGFSVCLSNSTSATRAPSYAGDNTSGAYLWGAQFETGAFATSYIPTTSASATRAADAVSLASTAFPLSTAAATLFSEFIYSGVTDSGADSIALGGQIDGRRLTIDAKNTRFEWSSNSVTPGSFNSSAGAVNKGAGALTVGGTVSAVWNAGTVATSASNSFAGTSTILGIGFDGVSARIGCFHIRKAMYLPQRLSNANLQSLTT